MKKILAVLIAATFIFSLASCGSSGSGSKNEPAKTQPTNPPTIASEKSIANISFKTPDNYESVGRYIIKSADGKITEKLAKEALDLLEVDSIGLDHIDRAILRTMIDKFDGGPVGTAAVATTIGEDQGTIEGGYEPYLVQIGCILRTPRGRVCSKTAYEHLGIPFSDKK